jgi:hypothetical protein
MIVSIKKTAKDLKINTPDLITRPVGRLMYSSTVDKLAVINAGEVVILDFEGIKVIDSSFIDEYIVKLIQNSLEKNFYLKLRNISVISEINIDSVFNSYSSYKDRRIAVSRDDIGRNNRFYIGPLSENESDILDYLRINQCASIEDISRFSGSDIHKIKKTLEDLLQLRVVKNNNGEFEAV